MTDEETYTKGDFSLTEWEDVNYCEHYFSRGDDFLNDKEVVDLLDEQHEQIQQLQKELKNLRRLANELYMEENE